MFGSRIRQLDVLKGIAIIMVIIVHYENVFGLSKWTSYLQMGCPILFVCSGLGIAILINKKYGNISYDRLQLKSFYLSRYISLAPGWYITILMVYIVNSIAISVLGRTISFGTNRNYISILLNALFLNGLFPFCNNNVVLGGWYIGTTAILYILTPIIYKFINKAKNKRFTLIFSSLICVMLWLVLKYFLKNTYFSDRSFTYFFFLVHLPEYMLGINLYYDLSKKRMNEKNKLKFLIAGMMLCVCSIIFFFSNISYGKFFSSWSISLATYCFLYNFINKSVINDKSKLFIILEKFGINSYYIYLVHGFCIWPVIGIIEIIFNKFNRSVMNRWGDVFLLPIVLFLCYIIGAIYNKFICYIKHLIKINFLNRICRK